MNILQRHNGQAALEFVIAAPLVVLASAGLVALGVAAADRVALESAAWSGAASAGDLAQTRQSVAQAAPARLRSGLRVQRDGEKLVVTSPVGAAVLGKRAPRATVTVDVRGGAQ